MRNALMEKAQGPHAGVTLIVPSSLHEDSQLRNSPNRPATVRSPAGAPRSDERAVRHYPAKTDQARRLKNNAAEVRWLPC